VSHDLDLENAVLRNLLAHTTRAYERQMEELHAEKELAQTTLASIGDGVITTDSDGSVRYLNGVAADLTGWSADEARGRALGTVFHLVSEASGDRLEIPAAAHLPAGHRVHFREPTLLVRRDGQRFAVESSSAPIRDPEGRSIGLVIVFQDVSDRRLLSLQLAHQATHDPLTGLVNRSAFDGYLERTLAGIRGGRVPGDAVALAYVDLDQFKVVNDTSGHSAGDELLRGVAMLLRDLVRESDVVARLGGDEFGVLLGDCPLPAARGRVDELHERLQAFRFHWEGRAFPLGASVGLVPVDDRFASVADLLSAADHACYVAKEKGGARIQVYHPEDAEFVRRHGEMEWVLRIQRTLEDGGFRLFSQEILPLAAARGGSAGDGPAGSGRTAAVGPAAAGGGRQLAFEVLLRMVDGDGELHQGTSDLIRAAERYGLMRRLDRWVVEHALGELGGLPPAVRSRLAICSLNLSALSLGDEEFLDFLEDAVGDAGFDPSPLCFEITETAAIENLPQARRLIRHLGRRGCRFALDDFGAGMASYGYLRDLRVDFVKIAGKFITDMVADSLDRAMVESIHQIAHLMGIATIGECVASRAALDLLREIGVDYAQGNWIAPPRPLGELSTAA